MNLMEMIIILIGLVMLIIGATIVLLTARAKFIELYNPIKFSSNSEDEANFSALPIHKTRKIFA